MRGCSMRRRPINTDADGNAKTIPAGYYKSGFTNLTRRMGGARDGFAATGIMETMELMETGDGEDTDKR